jgi:hypothetical protein
MQLDLSQKKFQAHDLLMISFDTSDLDISAVEVNGTSVAVSALVYV